MGYKKDLEEGKVHRGNFEIDKIFLKSKISLIINKKVLEIGCGSGQLAKWVSPYVKFVTAIDTSKDMINYANSTFKEKNINFTVMDGQGLRFKKNSYDFVLSFDVLEHIPNVGKHLKEVAKVLKPNGYYLLSTPNKLISLPFTILQNKSFTKHIKSHCSLLTYWALRKLFAKQGFEISFEKMDTRTEFLVNKAQKTLRCAAGVLKLINFKKLPLFLQTNFYIIAQNKEVLIK